MSDETPLHEAIRLLKGQSAVARACGGKTKQQHVSWWLNKRAGRVPPKHAPAIAEACRAVNPDTGITKEKLCPDFPWPAVDSTPA